MGKNPKASLGPLPYLLLNHSLSMNETSSTNTLVPDTCLKGRALTFQKNLPGLVYHPIILPNTSEQCFPLRRCFNVTERNWKKKKKRQTGAPSILCFLESYPQIEETVSGLENLGNVRDWLQWEQCTWVTVKLVNCLQDLLLQAHPGYVFNWTWYFNEKIEVPPPQFGG